MFVVDGALCMSCAHLQSSLKVAWAGLGSATCEVWLHAVLRAWPKMVILRVERQCFFFFFRVPTLFLIFHFTLTKNNSQLKLRIGNKKTETQSRPLQLGV